MDRIKGLPVHGESIISEAEPEGQGDSGILFWIERLQNSSVLKIIHQEVDILSKKNTLIPDPEPLPMLMLQLSLVTAYFSIAARRIQSVTLYSLLKLSLYVNCISKAFRYLLTDKIFDIGRKMFSQVDRGFWEAPSRIDALLGGIAIDLVNDFAQLSPVVKPNGD